MGTPPSPEQDAVLHGSCSCGRVTFTTTATPSNITFCHCGICRRQSGNPFLTFGSFPNSGVHFGTSPPRSTHSASATTPSQQGNSDEKHSRPDIKQLHSEIAVRGSCAACSSPLFMKYHCRPDTTDIVLGTVDRGNMSNKQEVKKEHIFVAQDPIESVVGGPGDGVVRWEGFDDEFKQVLGEWVKGGRRRRGDVGEG